MPHIDVHELDVTYSVGQRHLVALSKVGCSVESGTVTAIVGPSGCGKSTLLRCVAGLQAATSGMIRLDGLEAVAYRQKNGLGFCFQEDRLLPWRTVGENIELPFEFVQGVAAAKDQSAWKLQLLQTLGLSEFTNALPRQLSGGMRRRLALGRALIRKPGLLLLDEPLSGLDLRIRRELLVVLAALIRDSQITAIVVTHEIEEAVYLSSQVVLLSERPGSVIKIVPTGFTGQNPPSFHSSNFRDVVTECRAMLMGDSE
jgi:NitT/TauT family transport system ATP-binding protein